MNLIQLFLSVFYINQSCDSHIYYDSCFTDKFLCVRETYIGAGDREDANRLQFSINNCLDGLLIKGEDHANN